MHPFKTATFTQSLLTTGATFVNGIFAAIFYLLLARFLGPGEYGIFYMAITTIAITQTFLDFGTDRGMIKFLAKPDPDSEEFNQVAKSVFLYKVVVAVVVLLATSIFSRQLSIFVFGRLEWARLFPVIGFGLAAQMFFFFVVYYAQARQKYLWWGGLFVGTNAFRLILTIVFLFIGRMTASVAVGLYGIVPLVGFFVGLLLTGVSFLNTKLSWNKFRQVFGYNAWVAGASSVGAVSSRLDSYVTARFMQISQLGAYGLAGQAVIFVQQIISALGAVMGPKFAGFSNSAANHSYLKKTSLFSGAIAIGIALFMIPAGWIFFAFSGSQYLTAFGPFIILLASTVIFMITAPLRDSILYFYSRPHFLFWLTVFQIGLIILSGIILVPRYGLWGSAGSNLISGTASAIICIWYYQRLAKKPYYEI